MKEEYNNPWVTRGSDGLFYIIESEFVKEGNAGWTYKHLAGGFDTEEEAVKELPKYVH